MVVYHLGHSQGLVFRPTLNFCEQLTDCICNHVMEHIELCCNLCDTLTNRLTYTDSGNACRVQCGRHL